MRFDGLDEKDNQILSLLLEDARRTYSEIGEQIGLSRVAVKNRVKILEERGIIRGYHVDIDPLVIPESLTYFVIVETHPDAYTAVAEKLKAEDIVRTLYATEGTNRLQAICVAESLQKMRQFMRTMRDTTPGLTYLSYFTISEVMKGVILPD